MAIVNCPECQKQISDKAESCPNCGYRSKKASENVTTTQKTSKKLKQRQLLACIPAAISIIFSNSGKFDLVIACWVITFVLLIIIRLQIWWEHE